MRCAPAGICLALLALSCGPRRARWRPRQTAAGERSFAVVWLGATFRVAPDPRAPAVSLSPVRATRSPWLRDSFMAVHVLRERGDWAEVETLGPSSEAHCVPERPALRPLRLRLYVTRRALAPVTVREVAQRFSDGTSVRLSRGVPVERLSRPGSFRARLGALSIVLRLAPGEVGQRYLPSPAPPPPPPPRGSLSAAALRAGVPAIGHTGRVHSSARDVGSRVYHLERRGAESIAELRAPCATLRVRAPTPAIGEAPPSSTAPRAEPPPRPPWVEPGTAIFWPGGRVAGTVAARIALAREVNEDVDRRCFARALSRAGAPSAVLCFRRRDVIEPRTAARRLAPPTE